MEDNVESHIRCWNCDKRLADVIKGTVSIMASSDRMELPENFIVIETKCGACKKFLSMIVEPLRPGD